MAPVGTLSAVQVQSQQAGLPFACALPPSSRASLRERYRLLGERLFRDALLRERRRAERLDTPFAVLMIDIANGSTVLRPSVLRTLAVVKRDVDLVGWFERGVLLGLLLPGVSAKEALGVMDHVRREVSARRGQHALASLRISVYAHEDVAGLDAAAVHSTDLLVDALMKQRPHLWRDAVKRCLDVFGSLCLMALFSLVFAAIAMAVKWTSGGPVLFRQTRIGRRGEPFTMLKFRTMAVNSSTRIHEEYVDWFIRSSARQPRTGAEVFKLTDDARVTPVGRFLRRTSLDELPQFWNVLRGDLSLVGPRPPLPFEVERYQPWHRRRMLDAKPGVTGLWQVEGRSRITFDEMVRMDLRYARTRSLWTDIKILAATPRAMLKGAC